MFLNGVFQNDNIKQKIKQNVFRKLRKNTISILSTFFFNLSEKNSELKIDSIIVIQYNCTKMFHENNFTIKVLEQLRL